MKLIEIRTFQNNQNFIKNPMDLFFKLNCMDIKYLNLLNKSFKTYFMVKLCIKRIYDFLNIVILYTTIVCILLVCHESIKVK